MRMKVPVQAAISLLPLFHHLLILFIFYERSIDCSETMDKAVKQKSFGSNSWHPCQRWNSYSGDHEKYHLLGCDATQSGRSSPMILRNVLSTSSVMKGKARKLWAWCREHQGLSLIADHCYHLIKSLKWHIPDHNVATVQAFRGNDAVNVWFDLVSRRQCCWSHRHVISCWKCG
jgi:hypothetical protein